MVFASGAASAPAYLVQDDTVPCPSSSFVLMTPAEAQAVQWSPLNLSTEDGAAISVVIVATWAAAWAWRMIVKTLDTGDDVSTS